MLCIMLMMATVLSASDGYRALWLAADRQKTGPLG